MCIVSKSISIVHIIKYCIGFKFAVSPITNIKPLVAPERSEGATAQGLRVINSVDPCVLKSNYYLCWHIRLKPNQETVATH